MRFVFVGAGNLTVRTADLLIARGHEVVIIDPDRERIDELSKDLDCSFLHGDGSKPQMLQQADPAESDVLFALSDDDQNNIISALVARSLGFPRVVPRIADPQFENICTELGLEHYIVPDRTIARYLADMAKGIDVLNLSAAIKGDARLFSWVLGGEDAGLAKDIELPEQARIICLYREGKFQLVEPETQLKEGDEIVVIAHHDVLEALRERWGAAE